MKDPHAMVGSTILIFDMRIDQSSFLQFQTLARIVSCARGYNPRCCRGHRLIPLRLRKICRCPPRASGPGRGRRGLLRCRTASPKMLSTWGASRRRRSLAARSTWVERTGRTTTSCTTTHTRCVVVASFGCLREFRTSCVSAKSLKGKVHRTGRLLSPSGLC